MGRAISWTNRAKCPPIDDCPVKNTVQKGKRNKPTKKQQREAAELAVIQAQARETAKGKKEQKGMWPFAGSYDPKRERGR